ncbi:MAG: NAD-dependent epimerase/dehydratase family protein [Thermoplasmata archaeon]
MRAAVTGANGFIGRNLVKGLLKEGHEVLSIVRRAKKAPMLESQGSEVNVLELTQVDELAGSLEGADALFHLANVMVYATRRQQWSTNVVGTRSVLRAALRAGVSQLVYTSSVAVYGDTGNGWVTEDGPRQPNTHYGKTKVWAENIIRKEAGDMAWHVLRPGLVYGPGSPLLFHTVRRGPTLLDRGSNWVPFVHVADVVHALIRTAEKAESGSLFNVVDDRPLPLSEFFGILIRETGARLRHVPYPAAFLQALAAETSAYVRRSVPRLTRDVLRLYRTSARVTNERIKDEMDFRFVYPDPTQGIPEALRDLSKTFAM